MKDIYINSGHRIKELRMTLGYTREELAEMAGISPKFLYEIEKGKKGFSAETLYNMSNALNVKCDYIMTGNVSGFYEKEAVKMLEMFSDSQLVKVIHLLKLIYELK